MDAREAALQLMSRSLAVLELAFGVKTIADYERNLKSAVRGFWNGTYSYGDFMTEVALAIERGFNQAWTEGARSVGIGPDERTPEEEERLNNLIFEHTGYIPSLAEYVNSHLKADGFKLMEAQSRIPMWVNRYREVMNIAKTMAASDLKLVWRLGPSKIHCQSCLKLAGKVKRASVWMASGIRPQSPELECHGVNCRCELLPTDLPISRGRLPSIP